MWLARVKSPRPHHPTLRMAIPCPSIERSAVVTARAHLLEPTASSSNSHYAESMYPYRAVSGSDTARPFARGTWNRHPKSLMMRPRTLYVGKPHTNPVITEEAYTMNCPVETNRLLLYNLCILEIKLPWVSRWLSPDEGFPGAPTKAERRTWT